MTIRLVEDIRSEHLNQLYSDPLILRIGDDAHPARPIDDPLLSYVSVFQDDIFLGAYIVIDFSDYECEVHNLLLKVATVHLDVITKAFLNFVFARRNILRITAWIREDLKKSMNNACKHGFIVEGIKRNAVTVDGKPKNLIMAGLIREDWERPL